MLDDSSASVRLCFFLCNRLFCEEHSLLTIFLAFDADLTSSYQTTFVLSLSLITSNTGGQTKKMIVSAMIWLGAW